MTDWNRFWTELTPHPLRRARLLDALMRSAMQGLAAAHTRLQNLVADERRRRDYGPSPAQLKTLLDHLLSLHTAGCTWTITIADTPALRTPRLRRLRDADPIPLAADPVPLLRLADCTSPRSFTVTIRLRPASPSATTHPRLHDILRQAIDTHRTAGHQFTLVIDTRQIP